MASTPHDSSGTTLTFPGFTGTVTGLTFSQTEVANGAGDVIDISADDGLAIARGLSEYDAVDAARICGHRSSALAAILGTVPRSVLVHRDQLVLL